jgi:hypothetical protein
MRSLASKPLTFPSHLQPVCQAKSCLDLLHLDHMTQCHVSCVISSSIITCASFATSPIHFHLHGICCSHTCTYGLISCVSHINTISPPKVVTQLSKPNKDLSVVHISTILIMWWRVLALKVMYSFIGLQHVTPQGRGKGYCSERACWLVGRIGGATWRPKWVMSLPWQLIFLNDVYG